MQQGAPLNVVSCDWTQFLDRTVIPLLLGGSCHLVSGQKPMMANKSDKQGCSTSKWPKWLTHGGLLTTYRSWHDPPTRDETSPDCAGKKCLTFPTFFWRWNAERLCDWWGLPLPTSTANRWTPRTIESMIWLLLPCRSVRYLDVLGRVPKMIQKWRCFVRFWLDFFVSYNEQLFFFPLCFLGRPDMNGWLDFSRICQKFQKRTGIIFFHEWV